MPATLTTLERRILDYLIDYLRKHTYQPSIREIGRRFDIKSTKTVSEHLQSLADKGWVERDPSRSRGVRLLGLDLYSQTVRVPIVEDLAPPEAQLPRDMGIETLTLDRGLTGEGEVFALLMKDDSLAGAGILEGDLLLVTASSDDELEDGDLAAVRTGGEGLVRFFARRGDQRILKAAHPDHPAAIVRTADLRLVGRVSAVIRRIRPVGSPLPTGVGAPDLGDAV